MLDDAESSRGKAQLGTLHRQLLWPGNVGKKSSILHDFVKGYSCSD